MAYLRSISDEYDDQGNYIGNSPDGNREHGVEPKKESDSHLVCAGCGSSARRAHGGGGTCCASCGCSEAKRAYR